MNDYKNDNAQQDLDNLSNRLNSGVRHTENAMKSGLTTVENKQKEISVKRNDVNELRDRITDHDISKLEDTLKTRENNSQNTNENFNTQNHSKDGNNFNKPSEANINSYNQEKKVDFTEGMLKTKVETTEHKQYADLIKDKSDRVENIFNRNQKQNERDASIIKKNDILTSTKDINKSANLTDSMLKTQDTSYPDKKTKEDYDIGNLNNDLNKKDGIKKDSSNQLKTGVNTNLTDSNGDTLNVLKTSLLNKEKLAEQNGVHLKTKNGKIHSDKYIKVVGALNKKTFDFKQNQSKKSKVATVGLKTSKKVSGVVGKGSRLTTMANNVASSEDAVESGMNVVKTIAKTPINKVKNKVYGKVKSVAINTSVRSIKVAIKAMKMAVMGIAKLLIAVFGGISFLFIPCALVLIVICGFLSIFTGSPDTRESYETIFTDIQKEFDNNIKDEKNKLEGRKESKPIQGEFDGISEEDYNNLIKEQWREDSVFIQGFSQIDWKAQLVLIQNLKNNPELDNNDNLKEIKAIINYWKNNNIIEKHSTNENKEKYLVYWTNHYKEYFEEKEFIGKTKDSVFKQMNEYIDSLLLEDVEKVDYNYEYTEIKETYKDEDGEEHQRTKEWTLKVDGTIDKFKEESKEYTRTLYTINIENGHLNEYVNQTNTAFKNNDTASVGFMNDKKVKTLLAENNEYEKWDKISVSMDEQIREMYNQEGFMDEFSEKFRGSDNVPNFGGGTYEEGQYPFTGSVADWNRNNTFAAPNLNGQCTWFAYGRYFQTHNSHIPVHGNAGQWISECTAGGYTNIGKVPKVNSVIVLGNTSSHGEYAGCGHVAFIEAIEDDGKGGIKSITVSQGNIGAPSQSVVMREPFKYTKVSKYNSIDDLVAWLGSSYYLVGFIY